VVELERDGSLLPLGTPAGGALRRQDAHAQQPHTELLVLQDRPRTRTVSSGAAV